MDAVLLNGARDVDQVFVDHRHEGCVVLCGQRTEELIEGLDVVGTVVGWQCDAGEQNLDMGAYKRSENLIQILAGLSQRQAAQAIVAPELDDNGLRMKAQDGGQTGDGVFGGGSAGALIHNLIVVSLGVELPLKSVRE